MTHFLKVVHVVPLAEYQVRDIETDETLARFPTYDEAMSALTARHEPHVHLCDAACPHCKGTWRCHRPFGLCAIPEQELCLKAWEAEGFGYRQMGS